jgi:hypothetical protein
MPALTATLLWQTLNNLITAVSSQSLQNPNRPRPNYIDCLLAPCHFFSQYHAKRIEATEEEITSLGTCGRFQDGTAVEGRREHPATRQLWKCTTPKASLFLSDTVPAAIDARRLA